MKLATYISELTTAGVDANTATAHAKALEAMLDDKFITREDLKAEISDLKASIFQAMFLQALGIVGLTVTITLTAVKLLAAH